MQSEHHFGSKSVRLLQSLKNYNRIREGRDCLMHIHLPRACEELFVREKLDTVWLVNWRVLSRLIIAREGAKYSNCRHVTCILILSAHKRSAPEISFHLECKGSGNQFFFCHLTCRSKLSLKA